MGFMLIPIISFILLVLLLFPIAPAENIFLPKTKTARFILISVLCGFSIQIIPPFGILGLYVVFVIRSLLGDPAKVMREWYWILAILLFNAQIYGSFCFLILSGLDGKKSEKENNDNKPEVNQMK